MSIFNDSSSTITADESFTIVSDTEPSSPIPRIERSLFNNSIEYESETPERLINKFKGCSLEETLESPIIQADESSDGYKTPTHRRTPSVPLSASFVTPKYHRRSLSNNLFDQQQTQQQKTNLNPFTSPMVNKSQLFSQSSWITIGSGSSRYNDDFIELQFIGNGTFGSVFKCLHKIDNTYYAIKQLDLTNSSIKKPLVLKEMFALAALSGRGDFDKHIVRYFSGWCEDNTMYIQMELCDMTFTEYIKSNNIRISERLLVDLMKSILKGLSFIHAQDMVHLDIKPDNIFVHNGVYKIGDLGMATVGSGSSFISEGDCRYMAPELLNEDYSDLKKADIFSLGSMIYEFVRGKDLPLSGDEWSAIREGQLDGLNCSFGLERMIRIMMNPKYEKRRNASELLKDDLFKKLKVKKNIYTNNCGYVKPKMSNSRSSSH